MSIKTSGRFRHGEPFWRFFHVKVHVLSFYACVEILFFCFIRMIDVEIDKSKKTSVSQVELCRIFVILQFREGFCPVEVVFYYKI